MSFNAQWSPSDQDIALNSRKTKSFYMALSFMIGLVTFLAYMFVWYLCTRHRRQAGALQLTETGGLSKAALAALPTSVYKNINTGIDTNTDTSSLDCAVCLAQLQGGEKVRKLPKCKHLFHVECIDMWLYSHSTCPICRCDVRDVDTGKKSETSRVGAVPMPIPIVITALPV